MQFANHYAFHIIHDYYREGKCPDFTIAPSPETVALLKGHKMRVIEGTNGFRVVTEVNADRTPFVTMNTGKKMVFWLILSNPAFESITELTQPDAGNAWFFSNEKTDTPDPDDTTGFVPLARQQQSTAGIQTAPGTKVWGIVEISNNSTLPNTHQHGPIQHQF